jgi:dolichol kinase
VLPVYFYLGYWVIRLVAEYIYPHVPATEEALGNLNAFINAPKLEMGAIMAIFTFISIFLTIFPSEIARLRNWKRYPFQSIIEPALRPSEHDLFVSHIYISVNLALGVLILTYTPLTRKLGICAAMALVAICVCGDTTAAIIGTKYGKRKIPIAGSKKSVEGAVAGFLVSLIVGSLFAGPFIGMLGASIFLAIDLVTPRPIPITDNVLNPLVISVVFWLTLPLTLPMIPYF